MTKQQLIASFAERAVRREVYGFETRAGRCTAFAAECVARAYDTNRWVLYSCTIDVVKSDPDLSRWATDWELGLSRVGWVISRRDYDPRIKTEREALLKAVKPGDILFSSQLFDEAPRSSRTAPDKEGHVGIFVLLNGEAFVAENTRAERGLWWKPKSALRLTPLVDWDTVTSVARVPTDWLRK